MNCPGKSILAALALTGSLAGCATYDSGYAYSSPYTYGYGYDYGYSSPYYYDYWGPGYYVAPPALSFGFSYRDNDRHWSDRDRRWRDNDHQWRGRDRDRDGRGRDHDGRGGRDRGADRGPERNASASTAVPFTRGPEAPDPGAVRQGP
jgi:hypothetical protein